MATQKQGKGGGARKIGRNAKRPTQMRYSERLAKRARAAAARLKENGGVTSADRRFNINAVRRYSRLDAGLRSAIHNAYVGGAEVDTLTGMVEGKANKQAVRRLALAKLVP